MREFIYFSSKAHTSGNFKDLMKAGRLDIAIHFIINSFFLSNNIRDDVKLHLIFYGPPTPPRHITLISNKDIPISKKDVAGLIKRMLFKYKGKDVEEIYPGCFIDKKNFFDVIEEKLKEKKRIIILDKDGISIEKENINKDCVFVVGDHKGLPLKEIKRLKKIAERVSLGKKTYFASHVITIINYLLDKKEEN
ncbi:MAG: tRNA (pseudouridine(54)-N(1))-methyltransferase TrmY [Candidatus Pacearchaeota archaeon]